MSALLNAMNLADRRTERRSIRQGEINPLDIQLIDRCPGRMFDGFLADLADPISPTEAEIIQFDKDSVADRFDNLF